MKRSGRALVTSYYPSNQIYTATMMPAKGVPSPNSCDIAGTAQVKSFMIYEWKKIWRDGSTDVAASSKGRRYY
ncbi:hypothetical protein GWI33_004276 [Rhynchophorus ferrugineus]|uniref:Uncharacterized protein n=1 Tax=Rhynchophorus ferrugineus TaxID=354439 RepID=A0A834IJ20_RHYFE|nr:hypothetical protein GWI33_004276 [Rhynchophorus ferrugineus]